MKKYYNIGLYTSALVSLGIFYLRSTGYISSEIGALIALCSVIITVICFLKLRKISPQK